MKRITLLSILSCFFIHVFSQGFVGNGTNLYLTNSAGSATLSPFPKIGIGTSTPSAQLHTTQSVRFQGLSNNNSLTRVMVTDANGNVSWRDAGTIGLNGNFWSLSGNSITGTEFLGTTTNQPLTFRTNNIEQMRIAPNGYIGIGTNIPTDRMHVVDNTNSILRFQSSGGYAGIIMQGYGNTDAHSFISLDNTASTRRWLLSHRQADQGNSLYLSFYNGTQWDEQVSFSEFSANNVGLGLGTTTPNARLHTVGNLIFQNLPDGTGAFILTVDNAGNVFRTDPNGFTSGNTNTELLLKKIEELEYRLSLFESSNNINNTTKSNILFQNTPNPTDNGTDIRYQVLENSNSFLRIFDLNGKQINQINLTDEIGVVHINKGDLKAGMYIYSLVVNEKIIDSKKMLITE